RIRVAPVCGRYDGPFDGSHFASQGHLRRTSQPAIQAGDDRYSSAARTGAGRADRRRADAHQRAAGAGAPACGRPDEQRARPGRARPAQDRGAIGMTASPEDADLQDLKRRLSEAEETLRAIRHDEVDALVLETGEGLRVYTLEGAEYPYRRFVEAMQQGA